VNRAALLARLADREPWDILVIGGGATGLGTAVEAAARGYRTLLAEAHDFAKGTSSRSTKLVHGGVRYLRQGNIGLVFEALKERGRLLANAPHLVRNLSFVVPRYDWWEGPFYGAGLKLYDLLAGSLGLGPSRLLSRAETLAEIPTVEPAGLRGGVIYHDAQFDDARLALTLARTCADLGGAPINYLALERLAKDGDGRDSRVTGALLRDRETGAEHTVAARVVVNATGIFSDAVRRLDDPDAPPLLAPSQGVHLVLDRRFLPGESAIMLPHTDDGRVLFAIPWHGRTILGTTDTPLVSGEPPLEPRALPEEVEFLLREARRHLAHPPEPADVLAVFAGLRPLVRGGSPEGTEDTAALARDHQLLAARSGLVTITGGKWTTYRKMGEDTVHLAARVAGLPERPSPTAELALRGRSEEDLGEPWSVYGSDAPTLSALAGERPEWGALLHPRLPYRTVQVVWAVRHEMARTVEDVLARRTRALLLDARASVEAAPEVARVMAAELGRDAAWQAEQVARYGELATGYILIR